MRLLHTADWQIGTQFGQFSAEEAAHLTEARYETVRRIASLAAERKVNAVLVAGDVFDQQTVSDTVIRKLFAALAAYAGPWFMLPGNHDAALAESVWTRAVRLNCVLANVHLLLEPGVTLLDDAGVALLHALLTQRNTYDDTTGFFDDIETPAGWRVICASASRTAACRGFCRKALIRRIRSIPRALLDYLALGDWHGVYEVNLRIWYVGTPEQDRFRANEPGFVLDVRICAPGALPVIERVRIGKYRWTDLTKKGHHRVERHRCAACATRDARRERRPARARDGQRGFVGCAGGAGRHRGSAHSRACIAFIDDGTEDSPHRRRPRRARRAQRLSRQRRRAAARTAIRRQQSHRRIRGAA